MTNIFNIIKIYLGTIKTFDWILIIVCLLALVYMCYKNFKSVKQLAFNAMREAQIKYLGATGEERKKKAIQIFKSFKFVQNSAILRLVPIERLYNFFERIYQEHKEDIKAK